MFMMSSGGLTAADLFQGKDAILSGPAGGVVGMAQTGREAGLDHLIGFDMGGTSTDVSHFDGEYERAFETEVAGVRMRAPMMLIHSVAAGGGSVLHFDGARFRVGPDSAGANPGPKCYRRGGPLAVTDANVMVGKLMPDFFPKIFGPAAEPAARRRGGARRLRRARARSRPRRREEIADGFIKIAVENMANAIKKISVQRGYDVTRYALACFGGAGGQHACLVADALGMTKVLIHPLSSLLSAYGMGLADIRATREQAIEAPFGEDALATVLAVGSRLGAEARREVVGQGVAEADVTVEVRAHIRYAGTDTALVVPAYTLAGAATEPASPPTLAAMKAAFEAAHRARFGFIDDDQDADDRGDLRRSDRRRREILRAGRCRSRRRRCRRRRGGRGSTPAAPGTTAAVYLRDQLAPGHKVHGARDHHRAAPDHRGRGRLAGRDHGKEPSRCSPAWCRCARSHAIGTDADPVMLEVFNNLFMSIAEQMGVALQNTAYSVNIKERLDFSCAVFAHDGTLVANAPHMPVHLGSMDRAVETIIRENAGNIRPGDVYAINAPYNGGTHLPDITVCTPVFDEKAATSCSGSRAAAIMPTSAASRRARCRPTRRRSRRKASTSTTSSSSTAAASASRSSTRCSTARNIRRATPCRTSTTSRRRSRRTRRACRSCTR